MNELDWLLEDNDKVRQEQDEATRQRLVAQYGPICDVCGWPINHPVVQRVPHPGKTHDCYTGDPFAR